VLRDGLEIRRSVLTRQGRLVAAAASVVALASCTPHAARRPSAAVPAQISVSQLADREVRKEVGRHSAESHSDFDMAVVEFDDQGRLWSLDQFESLKRTLVSASRRSDGIGVGIVAFAHGWKHDARVCDEVMTCFRSFLANMAAETTAAASLAGAGDRRPRMVGVYLGWRGRSVTVPVLADLSFWARKSAAERIGAGELIEVLAYLDEFARQENEAGRPTMLTVLGHSFGGTMIYAAVANTLKTRLVEALERRARVPADENVVRGFGHLVVLVNPAIEASAFAPLHDLSNEIETYSSRQTPVLVVVGSETDAANRVWFPAGRWVQTFLERTGPRSPKARLRTAIGSYDPFTTHHLEAAAAPNGEAKLPPVVECNCQLRLGELAASELRAVGDFFRTHYFPPPWAGDKGESCSTGLVLGSVRLACLPGESPTQPVWIARATDEVVHGHSGFLTRPFLDFLRYLIIGGFSSVTAPALTERTDRRHDGSP
jgi:hypothetical protein